MCDWGGGPYGNGAYDPHGISKHNEARTTQATAKLSREDAACAMEESLEAIMAGAYRCDTCGVEYTEGYEGECKEPADQATWDARMRKWSRSCGGKVNAQGTARWTLKNVGKSQAAASR